MGEWKEYILEDIIDEFIDYRGKTPQKKESGIPLITAKIVKNGRILEPNEFIDPDDYDSWMTRGLPEVDDIVLTTEAPLGEVALIKNKKVALAQRIITLRGKKHLVYNPFLKYYFQSNIGQYELQSRASGTTVFGIKAEVLRKVPVFLPSISEQKNIASVLLSLDDKIDLLHRQNKTLEAMAETLFRQWFVEEADEGWKEGKLGDLIEIKHGYAFKGNYITDEETNNILVTPGNFKIGGGFKEDKFKYYSTDDYPKEYIFNENDLIVTMTDLSKDGDTLGYPAFVPSILGKNFLHNQRVGKVKYKNNYIEKFCYFLYFLMKTDEYRAYILGSASGTSILHTSPDRICNFQLHIPDEESIKRYNKVVSDLFYKIKINSHQIHTLEKLRDTLLPKLMSGEVRLNV